MTLFLYLAVVATALYWVSKMLLPEMAKPPIRPILSDPEALDILEPNGHKSRIEKLESLLTEKNKNIALLQSELKIFYVQVVNFDKIKSLLEDEIHHLREQNRIFRSELGIPAAQPKENSLT